MSTSSLPRISRPVLVKAILDAAVEYGLAGRQGYTGRLMFACGVVTILGGSQVTLKTPEGEFAAGTPEFDAAAERYAAILNSQMDALTAL